MLLKYLKLTATDTVIGKPETSISRILLLDRSPTSHGHQVKCGVAGGDSLAEAGQVLRHLGDESERAGRGFGRVFLH